MYVVTSSKTGEKHEFYNPGNALYLSMALNDIGNETIRGAIVTALHWIEFH